MYDLAGKEYIDFSSGIGVNSIGYGNEKWVAAIAAQAQKNTQADSPEQDSQTQAEAQPDAGEDRPKEDGEDPEQQKKE